MIFMDSSSNSGINIAVLERNLYPTCLNWPGQSKELEMQTPV